MVAKWIPEDSARLIAQYVAGTPANQLAKGAGVSCATMMKFLRRNAIAIRDPHAARHVEARVDASALVKDYESGLAIKTCARKYGLANSVTERFLRARGVLRTKSEGMATMWENARSRPDYAAFARHHMSAAIKARSTTPRTLAEMLKSASSMERNLRRRGHYEDVLAIAMRKRGTPVTQQKAIGRYNVDLAIEQARVHTAIEVQCSDHWRPHGTLSQERLSYLFARGWNLLVLLVWPKQRVDVDLVADRISDFVSRCRRQRSLGPYYGLIGHLGQATKLIHRTVPCGSRLEGF